MCIPYAHKFGIKYKERYHARGRVLHPRVSCHQGFNLSSLLEVLFFILDPKYVCAYIHYICSYVHTHTYIHTYIYIIIEKLAKWIKINGAKTPICVCV